MLSKASRKRQWAILLTCLVLTESCFSQRWEWVTPLPTGDLCYSVFFVDSLQGWIVAGGSGFVIHTPDGGKTWEYQDPGLRQYYSDVHFVNKDCGWVVGGDTSAVLSSTTDGGLTWLTKNFPADSSGSPLFPFKSIKFFDLNTGIAASSYEVLKTTDRGQTWDRLVINGKLRPVVAVSFLNANSGFALCDGLFETIDGGATWLTVNTQIGNTTADIYFRDTLNGWMADRFTGLSNTTDGGKTWQPQTGTISLQSLSFPDSEHGWAFGSDGIYASSDGGRSWQQQSTVKILGRGQMISKLTGFVAGGFGEILRTSNGGNTWDTLGLRAIRTTLAGIASRDARRVWVVGGDLSHGEVHFSSDEGASWTTQVGNYQSWLRGISFSDSLTGWICGDGGALLKSTDGGVSWQAWPSPTAARLWSILFKDANHGWSCGAGVILSTTDGGNSWNTFQVPDGDDIHGLCFNDTKNGWCVGGSVNDQRGIILHTTDGGGIWMIKYRELVNPFWSVSFQDSTRGWVAGEVVLKTTDGGTTWNSYPWTFKHPPIVVSFANPNVGWMVTFFGEIAHTTDGGLSWLAQRSPTSNTLWAIDVHDKGMAYAAGEMGSILKMKGGGLDGIRLAAENLSVWDFALSQNYPNPFNPSTTIRYEMSRAARITLEVFNILGQRVAQLVNGVQKQGRHEVLLDGKDLPVGVYLCRIQSGRHFEVKKMLLIK